MNREIEQVPRRFRPYFPDEQCIKRTLQRQRRKEFPRLPRSLTEIDIIGKKNLFKNFKPQYLSFYLKFFHALKKYRYQQDL